MGAASVGQRSVGRHAGRVAWVAGAGVGGLSAAVGLWRRGWRVRVVERSAALRPGGVLCLWGPALEQLGALGVRTHRLGTPVRTLRVSDERGALLVELPFAEWAAADGTLAPMLVRRDALLGELLDLLPGGTVRLGAPIGEVRPLSQGVSGRAGGAPFRADLLVGADGLRSAVAERLPGYSPPREVGQVAWWGRAPATEAATGALRVIVAAHAAAVWCAAPDGTWWTVAATDQRAADGVRAVVAGWPGVAEAVVATRPEQIGQTRLRDRDSAGVRQLSRIALLGDAARAMPPHLGQGANQALLDAGVLVEALERFGDVGAGVERYAQVRAAPVALTAWMSQLAAIMVGGGGPTGDALRVGLPLALQSLPGAARAAFRYRPAA